MECQSKVNRKVDVFINTDLTIRVRIDLGCSSMENVCTIIKMLMMVQMPVPGWTCPPPFCGCAHSLLCVVPSRSTCGAFLASRIVNSPNACVNALSFQPCACARHGECCFCANVHGISNRPRWFSEARRCGHAHSSTRVDTIGASRNEVRTRFDSNARNVIYPHE